MRPLIWGIASSRGSSWVTSCRLPPLSLIASGVPWASVITWCFEPGLARSTGLGPVLGRPDVPAGTSRRSPPATSPASPPDAARSATPGGADPTPRPRSSPEADASTSSPTRTRAPAAATPTGFRYAAQTESPADTAGHPAADAQHCQICAHRPATEARTSPTSHPSPATAGPSPSPCHTQRATTNRDMAPGSFLLAPLSHRSEKALVPVTRYQCADGVLETVRHSLVPGIAVEQDFAALGQQ